MLILDNPVTFNPGVGALKTSMMMNVLSHPVVVNISEWVNLELELTIVFQLAKLRPYPTVFIRQLTLWIDLVASHVTNPKCQLPDEDREIRSQSRKLQKNSKFQFYIYSFTDTQK